MTNTSTIPYLDHLLKWNEQLAGLPALPLVFIGCIALGYVLKSVRAFDNRYIPRWVFGFAIVLNLCLAPKDDSISLRIWVGRTVILGIITAASAWVVHKLVLKKIETKLGWFKSGDTEFFKKPEDT